MLGRHLAFMAALASGLTVSTAGTAEAWTEFGAAKHVVLGGAVFAQYYASPGSTGAASIAVSPNFHWFGTDSASIGLYLSLTYQNNGSSSVTGYSLEPAIGYSLSLGERVSLWPQLLFSWASSNPGSGFAPFSNTVTRWGLGAYVPFIYRPTESFFFGFGPNFSTDLSARSSVSYYDAAKITAIGLQSILGGCF